MVQQREPPMDLDQEILSRIKSICALDKATTTRDFQIRAGENGSVLINLRTGKAEIIFWPVTRIRKIH